jgi:large repetitive protein
VRDRWRLFVAVMIVSVAGALAVVASSKAAITITSVQVQAGGANIPSASGPLGAGYDIRIVANVSSGDTWRATRWTSGGVSYCLDHDNVGSGNDQSVTLPYAFQKGLLRETPVPQDLPPGAGNAEHVFPPPPGPSQLTVAVFNTNDCSGSPSSTQSVTLTTTAPAANPPLIAACQELKVAVVLDESGSIGSAGATQKVRDATKALAQGLVGTGASMAVFKFSTTRGSTNVPPYQTVTQSFINGSLANYLNNYSPANYTNWHDGLLQVQQATASNRPDLIIFLTDGNPNRFGNGSGQNMQEGEYRAMNPAVVVADQLKQSGSHMFVIGMGDGVTDPLSALRLQAVSGTKSFPTYPISIADYTLVTNFDELAAALANLASNLCNVTVTVTKETDEQTRDAWVSKAGWGFSGRVLMQAPADQFSYGWFKPNVVDPVSSTTATQSGSTAASGNLDFVWRPKAAGSLSNITISETPPAAFEPESVTCTSGSDTIFSSEVPATVASFTLTGLKVRDKVDCVVRNRFKRSAVQVVKQWVGDPASATIFVDATGATPFDASTNATTSGASASFAYPVSTSVRVGETVVPAGYTATIDCGGGPQPYSGGPFAVTSPAADGAVLTCTITNRQLRSTVQVVKQWEGAPSSATIFVDRNGTAPYDAQTVAIADGDSTKFTYPVGTPVTVGEVAVPQGYEATIHCGPTREAPLPYNGGRFDVTAPANDGGVLTCTITNVRQLSQVRVVKNWVGAAGTATIFVDADGTAPFDASTVAAATGDSASFTYPTSTNVTLGETAVPAGYSATINCGQGPQAYGGGPFPVTSPAVGGATATCVVTNTQQLSIVRVEKRWVGPAASATIFVDATGAAPFDASTLATATGDSASFTYPISTAVTVGETAVPTGYAATIQCGGAAPQAYGGGPFAVNSPATDGATITCTITNTQQRSTVRVVKNWSGTPSTATVFVDADGVAPFDASTLAPADGDNASFTYQVSTPVFVGETSVPTGYTATIQCGAGLPVPYAGGPFAVTSPATNGATLICTISNNLIPPPATVRVIKDWIGDPASTTIFVDQNGVAPFDASTLATASGHNTSFDYVAGTAVTVGETAVPTGYAATIQCGAGARQPYTGGAFAVTAPSAGSTLTCTITNTQLRSTVSIVKEWEGAPSSATIFVDATGAVPFDASTVATTDGASVSFSYPISTSVTVGETAVPPGYAATIQCGSAAPQAYTGGPFPVTSPGTDAANVSCTITNTQQLSYVRVVKQWVGEPSEAEIFVDANGTAPYDASTVATANGDSAFFQYPTSTPVTVGETAVPEGYAATVQCGALQARQAYNGGPFPVTSPANHGAVVTCTITNTQQLSTVQVIKNWVGDPASTTIFVDADGAAPFDDSTVATTNGANALFTYQVSTPVTVGETTVPAGYRATIDCGDGPQAYTGGPFPVTSPAVDGDAVACTITNIQLRSTVQVVKDWAGGASTATIFVDANGAAPFDASTVATASGQSASASYPVSTAVTVGEAAVPSGYTATIDCGGGPQDYGGGAFAVTAPAEEGAALTCTITNTPQATVRVVKSWLGRPNTATIFVDRVGQTPYDVSTVAQVDGESASFDYRPSTPVTVGEITVPSGYRALVNCGTGPRDLRRYSGGAYAVTAPATPNGVITCTVINTQTLPPGRLVIRKTASRKVVRSPKQFEFRFTVRNTGRGVARAVRVCDPLPKGLVLVRGYGARLERGALCWHITRLRPGARKKLRVLVRPKKTNRPIVIVNIAEVAGVNTPNCPRIAIARRAQRPGCTGRARVRILAARVLQPPKRRPKPPFTG